MEQADGEGARQAEVDLFAVAWTDWVRTIHDACLGEAEWPEKVGAGLYAAIEFLVREPKMARALLDRPDRSRFRESYGGLVQMMSELLAETISIEPRLGADAPAAAVAGVGLMVGDRLRTGQACNLQDLRPEMHLMILLPFLGFDEAKFYVEEFSRRGLP